MIRPIKPELTVIEGDGAIPSPWLDPPPTVAARSPIDANEPVMFRIARHDIQKALAAQRREPIFNLWSIVLGRPPPVPGVAESDDELTCLMEAHACFQGIQRPIGIDNDGEHVLAYVLRPRSYYVYVPSMVCVAEKAQVLSDLVFVAYVRLDEPIGTGFPPVIGVLTHWQFVEATYDNGQYLPVQHQTRYRQRRW